MKNTIEQLNKTNFEEITNDSAESLPVVASERREEEVNNFVKKMQNEAKRNQMIESVRNELNKQESVKADEYIPEVDVVFENEDEIMQSKPIDAIPNENNQQVKKTTSVFNRAFKAISLAALTALGVGTTTEANAARNNHSHDALASYEANTQNKLSKRHSEQKNSNIDMRDAVSSRNYEQDIKVGASKIHFKFNSKGELTGVKYNINPADSFDTGKVLKDNYYQILRTEKRTNNLAMAVDVVEARAKELSFLESVGKNNLRGSEKDKKQELAILKNHIEKVKKSINEKYGEVFK